MVNLPWHAIFLSGEDSKEMSAAGQMDTILGVKGMSQVKHHNLHTKVKIHYTSHVGLLS